MSRRPRLDRCFFDAWRGEGGARPYGELRQKLGASAALRAVAECVKANVASVSLRS